MAKCKLIRSSIPAKITGEIVHLAWTNPNPNTTFANTQVTLNTDGNYSRIKVKCKIFYADTSFFWREFKKGDNNYIEVTDLNNLRVVRRALNYVSDNKWNFGSGVIRDMYSSSGQAANDGRYIIPIEIYTYNDTFTAEVTAIASSVKTNAQNCMMSDGVTDVESFLGDMIKTFTTTKSYTLPAVGSNVDVSFTLSTPTGYKCIGIINYITNTGNALANAALSSATTGFLTITNIANSGQAGTTRTAQWTEVYVKNVPS